MSEEKFCEVCGSPNGQCECRGVVQPGISPVSVDDGSGAVGVAVEPVKPKFDRTGYMRAYMRRRREQAKS
jgi:hypothetical protein